MIFQTLLTPVTSIRILGWPVLCSYIFCGADVGLMLGIGVEQGGLAEVLSLVWALLLAALWLAQILACTLWRNVESYFDTMPWLHHTQELQANKGGRTYQTKCPFTGGWPPGYAGLGLPRLHACLVASKRGLAEFDLLDAPDDFRACMLMEGGRGTDYRPFLKAVCQVWGPRVACSGQSLRSPAPNQPTCSAGLRPTVRCPSCSCRVHDLVLGPADKWVEHLPVCDVPLRWEAAKAALDNATDPIKVGGNCWSSWWDRAIPDRAPCALGPFLVWALSVSESSLVCAFSGPCSVPACRDKSGTSTTPPHSQAYTHRPGRSWTVRSIFGATRPCVA